MKLSLIVLGAIAILAALLLKWGSKTETASSEARAG
jgi:FtsZ-interacting cell division protein ZipA